MLLEAKELIKCYLMRKEAFLYERKQPNDYAFILDDI